MSAIVSSMSEPATSTEKTAVMSPDPSTPGPARSAQAMIAGRDRRGIAAQGGDLTPGKGNLAVGLGKAGDRIGQQQDMQPLVAEMLGHGHGGPGAAAADQGRLVGGCGDDDGALHPLGSQHAFDEFAQFPATFADQRDDHDIGADPAGEFAQQGGFADAGACEKPYALTAHQWQQGVKHGNPGFQPLAKAAAVGGRRGGGQQRARAGPTVQGTAVERCAEGVDHPADPGIVGRKAGLADQPHRRADGQTLRPSRRSEQ